MNEKEQQFNQWFDQYANGVKVFEEADMKQAYLQGRAELKARLQKKVNTTTVSDYPYSALKLEEAKEIIALGLRVCETSSIEYMNWYQKRAEQFLKEIEK